MKIGIDFDNTIICYDNVFANLAKEWKLIPEDYEVTKQKLRDLIRQLPDGETIWQKMQGKVYGELIHNAELFDGFIDFISLCNADPTIEIYIVSHKTKKGHFTDVNLRDAAREWLLRKNLLNNDPPFILEKNIFFENTREKKIMRIKKLDCTHFIDDLIEVFESPSFPNHIERLLFQGQQPSSIKCFANWIEIKNAFFI